MRMKKKTWVSPVVVMGGLVEEKPGRSGYIIIEIHGWRMLPAVVVTSLVDRMVLVDLTKNNNSDQIIVWQRKKKSHYFSYLITNETIRRNDINSFNTDSNKFEIYWSIIWAQSWIESMTQLVFITVKIIHRLGTMFIIYRFSKVKERQGKGTMTNDQEDISICFNRIAFLAFHSSQSSDIVFFEGSEIKKTQVNVVNSSQASLN